MFVLSRLTGLRNRLVAPIVLVGMAFATGNALARDGKSDPAKPMVTVNLTISTFPLLDYCVPVFVGIEQGFFEKEGIKIGSIVSSEGGGTTVRNLLTGGMDMGVVGFPAAVQANIAGAPLPVIESDASRVPTFTLVVADDSRIGSLADAVQSNATFGYSSPNSATQALLYLTLQRAGFDHAKINSRPTGGLGGGFTAVRGGSLEVTSAAEPFFSRAGKGLRPIHKVSDNVPKFQQAVWVVNPQFAKANPDAVKGFLRARQAAVDWIADNLEEAARLYSEKAEISLPAALSTLKAMEATGGVKAYYGVGFDQEAMEVAIEGMRLLGSLKPDQVVPWKEILDQTYLPNDAPRVDIGKFSNPTRAK